MIRCWRATVLTSIRLPTLPTESFPHRHFAANLSSEKTAPLSRTHVDTREESFDTEGSASSSGRCPA